MVELARGLVGSEYWEFIHLLLVTGLEEAKALLEQESTSDDKIRFCQGQAAAYRAAINDILRWSDGDSEEINVG
jgi:hypothetical protein